MGKRSSHRLARHGAVPLLAAPLVEESPRCFPDPWEPSLVGVAQILHRLLRYAGLDGWRLELVDGRAPLADPLKLAQPRIGFIAAEGDRLSFQLEELGTPEWVPAALCFEVGRAFVATRESRHPYRAAEDDAQAASPAALVEAAVATVYLGFGLITSAAHGFAQEGEIVGQMAVTRRAHLALGALPAGDLTFLPGVQLVLRGLSLETAAPLLRPLAQNQADDVRVWLERLVDAGPALRARLGIAETERPPPMSLPEVGPLPASTLAELEAAEEQHLHPHSAVRVTRYWERKTVPGLFIGLFASMAPLIPVALAGWTGLALALLPAGTLVGTIIGRTRRTYYCGSCWMTLRAGEAQCFKCGAGFREDAPLSARRAKLDEEEDEELVRQALASEHPDAHPGDEG